WIAAHAMTRLHLWIDPLLPSKLRALAIALLVPSSLRLGAILLLTNTFVALALAESLRAAGPAFGWYLDEPWLTLLFAGLAFVPPPVRRRARPLDEALARERARSDALPGLARLVSAVRDRANTPLQTLELGLALIGEERPALVEPMRAALADSRD